MTATSHKGPKSPAKETIANDTSKRDTAKYIGIATIWVLASILLLGDTSQALRNYNMLEDRNKPSDIFDTISETEGGLIDVPEMFSVSISDEIPKDAVHSPITAPVRIQFRAPEAKREAWLVCVYTLLSLEDGAPDSLSFYTPSNAHPATSKEARGCPRIDTRAEILPSEFQGHVSNGLSLHKLPLSKPDDSTLSISTSALTWNPRQIDDDGYERQTIRVSYDSAMPLMFSRLKQQSLETYFAKSIAEVPSQGGVALDDIGVEIVIMPNVARGDRVIQSHGGRSGGGNISGVWNSGQLYPRIDAAATIENPKQRQLAQTQLQISIAITGILLALALTKLFRSILTSEPQKLARPLRPRLMRQAIATTAFTTSIFLGLHIPIGIPFTKLISAVIGIN